MLVIYRSKVNGGGGSLAANEWLYVFGFATHILRFKAITQWQYELLEMVVNVAQIKVKNNCDLAHVSGSFNHETISKIRNSQSDAEARRIIANHVKNYR